MVLLWKPRGIVALSDQVHQLLIIAVKLHYRRVQRRFLGLISNEAIAEELTQEVFTRLCDALHREPHRSDDALWPLIAGITKNVFFEHLRRKSRQKRDHDHYSKDETTDAVVPADQRLGDTEEIQRLRAFVSQLSPRDQQVLEARHVDDMSGQEMAERFGAPRTTVLAWYDKAIKRLRAVAKKSGFVP